VVHTVEGDSEAVVLPDESLVGEPIKKAAKRPKNQLKYHLTRYYVAKINGLGANSEGLFWSFFTFSPNYLVESPGRQNDQRRGHRERDRDDSQATGSSERRASAGNSGGF
jgi:hypothetical protein